MAASEPAYARAIVNSSPNFWASDDPHNPRMPLKAIVLHGTGGAFPGCMTWLCRPNGDSSAHYLVTRDGTVYALVPESASAWANGLDHDIPGGLYPALPSINRYTLSIETVNDTANSLPHTPAQHAAVVDLIRDIRRRHGPLPLVPHSAIDPVTRAHCPGDKINLAAIDKEATITTPPKVPAKVPAKTTPTPADKPVVELTPYPYDYNQYADWTADGQPDENASSNCGFEVDSQMAQYLMGLNMGADVFKDIAMGQNAVGYSDWPDHEKLWEQYLGSQTGFLDSADADTVRQHVMTWLRNGTPAMVLLWWNRQQRTGGHFEGATGFYADGRLILANPAGGTREVLTPAAFKQAFKGGALRIKRTRSIVRIP